GDSGVRDQGRLAGHVRRLQGAAPEAGHFVQGAFFLGTQRLREGPDRRPLRAAPVLDLVELHLFTPVYDAASAAERDGQVAVITAHFMAAERSDEGVYLPGKQVNEADGQAGPAGAVQVNIQGVFGRRRRPYALDHSAAFGIED